MKCLGGPYSYRIYWPVFAPLLQMDEITVAFIIISRNFQTATCCDRKMASS